MPINHTKVLLEADGPDATKARPSDWNDDHTLPTLGELTNGDLTWNDSQETLGIDAEINGHATITTLGAGAELDILAADGTAGSGGNGGEITIKTGGGDSLGSGDGGALSLTTGGGFGGGASGDITIKSGGVPDASGGDSGELALRTEDGDWQAGQIIIQAGQGRQHNGGSVSIGAGAKQTGGSHGHVVIGSGSGVATMEFGDATITIGETPIVMPMGRISGLTSDGEFILRANADTDTEGGSVSVDPGQPGNNGGVVIAGGRATGGSKGIGGVISVDPANDYDGGSAIVGGGGATNGSTPGDGGDAVLAGGYGGPGFVFGASVTAKGGKGDGTGGNVDVVGSDAKAGSGSQGGDVTLTTGAGDGAGRHGLIFPTLPTSDPGVSGALWNDNGVLRLSGSNGNRTVGPINVTAADWNARSGTYLDLGVAVPAGSAVYAWCQQTGTAWGSGGGSDEASLNVWDGTHIQSITGYFDLGHGITSFHFAPYPMAAGESPPYWAVASYTGNLTLRYFNNSDTVAGTGEMNVYVILASVTAP